MGFRFRKSIKAGPLRINLSKSGVGYSIGGKGFRYTKKASGGTRTTASIPGTGISYVTETGKKKRGSSMAQHSNTPKYDSTPQRNSEVFTETFRPVGIVLDEIKKLAHLNADWKLSDAELLSSCTPGQKIYQIHFTNTPVQLISEPDNAVAVVVAGHKIGYVGPEANAQITKILKSGTIQKITCGIFGGQYKVINDDYTVSIHKPSINIIVRVTYTLPVASKSRQQKSSNTNNASKTALILAILLGWAGVHKFYQKRIGMGILYLFTFGLFSIGWIGDIIQLCIAYSRKRKNSPLSKFQKATSYIIAAILVFALGSCGGNSEGTPDTITTEPSSTSAVVDTEASETDESIIETTAPTETTTEATTAATTDPPQTEPTTQATTDPKDTEPKGTTYILNTNSKVFHYPSCGSVKKMKESNKKEYTGTREEVINKGYKSCGNCHP